MAQNKKPNSEPALDPHGRCPTCHASWDGGPIPEQNKEWYSPQYRFSRLIGVEIQGAYDGVVKWRCPDCSAEWDRFSR